MAKCNIRFDNAGRSLGIADVYYKNRTDAQDAIDALNNRTLDGTRLDVLCPMVGSHAG